MDVQLKEAPSGSARIPTEEPTPAAEKEVTTPQGTVTVLMGYMVVIIVLWGYMYAMMLLMR